MPCRGHTAITVKRELYVALQERGGIEPNFVR
jgi:hypothetical protein